MNKIKTKFLLSGDLWRVPKHHDPWILLKKEKVECDINPNVFIWKLTWFGKNKNKKLEIIEKIWVECSAFEIISRKNVI